MPEFTVEALVNRARTYIDDDHADSEGFISPDRWLDIFNAEYAQHFCDWIRMGLISPAPVDEAFTSYTHTIEGVLVTIGVAEDLGGGRLRVLQPAQSSSGRSPFWDYTEGTPVYWRAHGTANNIVYTLEPRVTGDYLVRYIGLPEFPQVAAGVDEEDEPIFRDPADNSERVMDIPYGCDERIVLGMARRAKLKDGAASALLERLIHEADGRINMLAFGRADNDGPRVRRTTRGTAPRVTQFSTDPRMWRYS